MNVAELCVKNIDRYGEYSSFHFSGVPLTNVAHSRRAGVLAAVLRERGLGPTDRLLVMMPNSPDVLASFQAAWRLGAIVVPVTAQLEAREVRYLIESSGAKLALTTPALVERLCEATRDLAGFEHLLSLGAAGAEQAEDLLPSVDAADPVEVVYPSDDADVALLVYTAGTTGRPKGVMLTHRNLLEIPRQLGSILKTRVHTSTLHALPLSHLFGVMMAALAYELGWVSVVLPRWHTESVFEAIQAYRIERFGAVPTMLRYMIDFADRTKYDTSSLVGVWSGGAPLPNEVRLAFEATFRCSVSEGYSQSEGAGIGVSYWDGDRFRPGAAGRALPEISVRVVGADDGPLPPRREGEICLKGPNVMRGYWQDDEATRKTVIDGWLHTGDLGYLDEEGFLYITGRKKDLIIKGGENIGPREIEEAIAEHPAVAEVSVVGVPDARFGEEVWAAVALRPGMAATEAEIRTHVGRYVMKFKVPARVVFLGELPKSAVGKILKREIRAELARMVQQAGSGAE